MRGLLGLVVALGACGGDPAKLPDACVGTCDAPADRDAALAMCGARACGPDGIGGTCGTCAAGTFCSSAGACRADQLEWSGIEWKVRSGTGGPGPNTWDPRNVSVDDQGRLHLSIAYRDGKWTTAEILTTQPYGFGRYEWFVDGQLDQLDRNIVLGLFTYTTAAVGPDGTNEIDIEIARWGNSSYDPLNYNVWPAVTGYSPTGTDLPMTLFGTHTTHRFDWRTDSIEFGSYHGFRTDNVNPIGTWSYAPADNTIRIPQAPVPLHLNLWLFQGMAPANGAGVEIVVPEFHFTAL
jgi:hypothetical protein